jgi:hypothetical protein
MYDTLSLINPTLLTADIMNATKLYRKIYNENMLSVNPSAPTIRGLIKIHKVDSPFRPIVN